MAAQPPHLAAYQAERRRASREAVKGAIAALTDGPQQSRSRALPKRHASTGPGSTNRRILRPTSAGAGKRAKSP
jgi:hypothetical protein